MGAVAFNTVAAIGMLVTMAVLGVRWTSVGTLVICVAAAISFALQLRTTATEHPA